MTRQKMYLYQSGREVVEMEVDVSFGPRPPLVAPLALPTADTATKPGYPDPVSKTPSGKNIPEDQRGEEGELVAIRARRGTKARVSALRERMGLPKLGKVLEAALDALERELEK